MGCDIGSHLSSLFHQQTQIPQLREGQLESSSSYSDALCWGWSYKTYVLRHAPAAREFAHAYKGNLVTTCSSFIGGVIARSRITNTRGTYTNMKIAAIVLALAACAFADGDNLKGTSMRPAPILRT